MSLYYHSLQSEIASLGELLLQRGEQLAVAESCTAGMLGGALASVAGSSAWFVGGVITYSNEMKQRMLGVPQSLLSTVGAVSPEVAEAMALGACRECAADSAIAITGIAGPGGGSPEKPVGLVYIAAAYNGRVVVQKNLFAGDRDAVRMQSVETGLSLLRSQL